MTSAYYKPSEVGGVGVYDADDDAYSEHLWDILRTLKVSDYDDRSFGGGVGAGGKLKGLASPARGKENVPPPAALVAGAAKARGGRAWNALGLQALPEVYGAETEACGVCGVLGKIQIDDGHHVCTGCCSILERVIDTGAEWRYYGAEDSRESDPTRCGMPTNHLMPKSSLGSVIGGQRRDHQDIRRIRRFQLWNSMPHSERALYNVFDQIKVNTIKYGIPSKVVDDAIVLYKKASEQKISRGENKEGLIASCIYHACLINKVSRSAKEVSQMFGIDGTVLTKGNARFQNLLHMNVDSAGPEDFIGRFGSKLNMDYEDIQKCKAFVKRLDEMEIVSENAPTSVAAGALYFYCTKKKLTELGRPQIAAVCEVSEVTIIKCYKRLTRFREVDEACVV